MSTEEPVSAYSVFKAAKDMADNKKKFKKKFNGLGKNKNVTKRSGKVGNKESSKLKNSNKSVNGKVLSNKNKSNSNKTKISNSTKLQAGKTVDQNSHTSNLKSSEDKHRVKQLRAHDSKKIGKVIDKDKKDVDYLVKQIEIGENENGFERSSDSSSEEDDTYSASETYIDGSGSFSEESINFIEDDNKTTEPLIQTMICKNIKKRKSPDVAATKTKSDPNKRSKKSHDPKIASVEKIVDVSLNHRRTSLVSKDDFYKKSTTKAASTKIFTTPNIKLEPLSPPTDINKLNSIEEGKRAFQWLLNPLKVDDFFAKYWEQSACLIKRQQSNYFSHLISFEDIDQMLLKNHVEFTKNIDVTLYENGVRETLNPQGRALPPVVWDRYDQGCSIRLLNPQTFLSSLFKLCTTMQEYFHCLVGANAYLTPPKSQGFSPHYDDIEAFVLQIEGRKRWKLYKPRNTLEILPRYSSKNFNQEEIGKPVFEEVLEPGDVLYFPRGTIHQANTEPGNHSLHITLSVYQKQTFADLFEKMLPIMLQKAIAANVDMRRGLPLQSWQHAGIAFSDNSSKERADLTKKVTELMHKCINEMSLQDIMDAGIDQLAKKFQHEALPPEILPSEKMRTVFGSRSKTNEIGECVCDYDIDERTNVRLLRANIMRLVKEEDKIHVYYYLDNSKEYCEYEANFIEIETMEAASVEVLIKSYPQYVGVSQLPLPTDEHKINLVTALWERGLLMMEKPFK